MKPFARCRGCNRFDYLPSDLCAECHEANAADLATRDAEARDLERRYAEPPEYQFAELERWQDGAEEAGLR